MLPFGGLDIIVILYRPTLLQMTSRSHDVLLSLADNPSSVDAEHKGTISLMLLRIPEPDFALIYFDL